MENKEILDHFGRLLIKEAYDNHLSLVKHDISDLRQTERFKKLFSTMSQEQKLELENLVFEILSGIMFDFLRIFEENREFKIYYESKGLRIDLAEITEMLKAEPIIENGWIDRFSEYSAKKDKESFQ